MGIYLAIGVVVVGLALGGVFAYKKFSKGFVSYR
jgi:hypothetical protein